MSPTEGRSEDEACPVCGSYGGRPVYPEARDPITSDAFRIVECPACAVAYTAPRPANLDRYYPDRYRAYGRVVSFVLERFYDARVARWAALKRDGGSVLEVGCGAGLMLASFRRHGWRVLGIERNETLAAQARQTHGIDVVATPVSSLPADARFDMIIMFNVLEHIGEPVTLLRDCAQRLAPGGRLITNVPNFASWQSRFAGATWLHLDPPRHLVHFTPATLSATLERAGLKLVGMSYVSMEHDPYGWTESIVNRVTGRSNTLTKFLMGLEPLSVAVVISLFLSAALALPALIVAVASWMAGRGALMEVVAVRGAPEPSPGQAETATSSPRGRPHGGA